MTSVTALRSAPFTRDDLDAMPDDGRRYEIIDGALLVTPAPGDRHQGAVVELIVLLHAACPPDLRVRTAPYDVRLSDDTVVQPDVLVARADDIDARGLAAAPLLAVEVLSPSTRLVDLNLKHARYAAAGCPSYWAVDLEAGSLTAWELRGETYVEVAHVVGDEKFTTTVPFELTITPARLLD